MLNKTKGMILAAGYGTRLGNITKEIPKCLVDINGKSILQRVIERFISAGITSIAINVHYLSEKIEDFLNLNNNFGIDIYVSKEDQILGTGGGIKHAKRFLDGAEYVVIHNSDVYSDLPLQVLLDFHKNNSALVTLGAMSRDTERPLLFSKLLLKPESNAEKCNELLELCGWENTGKGIGEVFGNDSSPITLAFSGIQVISSDVFKYMEDENEEFSSIRIYLKAARAGKRVFAFQMDNYYWIDMGTPEKLSELRRVLLPKEKFLDN